MKLTPRIAAYGIALGLLALIIWALVPESKASGCVMYPTNDQTLRLEANRGLINWREYCIDPAPMSKKPKGWKTRDWASVNSDWLKSRPDVVKKYFNLNK